ncbi:MAG: T9SS type A sorting domain-containing protein [Gemmatimonadales bacterium]|nr:T9SS type A sorting domain-containing protein [Gemmatimonadales bacterium]
MKTSRVALPLLLALCLLSHTVSGDAACIDYHNVTYPVGSLETSSFATGNVSDMALAGTLLYTVDGGNEFYIVDVQDKYNPIIIGSVSIPTGANKFRLTTDYSEAIVAGSTGLARIDVTDPHNPTVTATMDLPDISPQFPVATLGDLAITFRTEYGLGIYDISDPLSFSTMSHLDLGDDTMVLAIAAQGDYVYVSTDGELLTIEISVPGSPRLRRTEENAGSLQDLAIVGGWIFAADAANGIKIWNISNAAKPEVAGTSTGGPSGFDIAVVGDRAYVAGNNSSTGDGFSIFDVADPQNPLQVDFVESDFNLAIAGDSAYAYLGGLGGLQIYRLSDSPPPAIQPVPVFTTPTGVITYAEEMFETTDRYFLLYSGNLYVFDKVIESDPLLRNTIVVEDHLDVREMVVSDDIVYFAKFNLGLDILDLSDVDNPVWSPRLETPGFSNNLRIYGTLAYLCDGFWGVQIVDISDPFVPEIIGSMDTPDYAEDVILSDGLLYVADAYSGLQIVDVTTPSSPFIIGSIDGCDEAFAIAKVGNLVALADKGIKLFDVSTPTSPTLLSFSEMPGLVHDVEIIGNFGYAANDGIGYRVIDLRDPAKPRQFALLDADPAGQLRLFDNTLYCGPDLGIIPLQCEGISAVPEHRNLPAGSFQLQAYPNPFNPQTIISFNLPEQTAINLRIFDISGRLVSTILDNVVTHEGHNQVVWRGQSDSGRQVASGIYFYRLEAGAFSEAKRVVLVK